MKARWTSGGTEAPELELGAEQTATLLPAGVIPDDEVIILQLRPSLMFVPLSSLGSLAAIAVVTLAVALLTVHAAWLPLTELQVYALGIAVAAGRLLWQVLEWWGRLYVLTDRRILARVGVLRITVLETPLRDIQHTSVFQPLREQLFGLGTIGFATTGSHTFNAFWATVRQPVTVHKTVVEAIER